MDFAEFNPGKSGSIEFGVHVLERPLKVWLKGTDWDDLDPSFIEKTDATLRYLECPKDVDATITKGSLKEVLTAMKRGIPLDGNRSYGERGPFDEGTTHGFELEWEVPKSVKTDRGHFEFGFEAKAADKDKKDGQKRKFTVHAIDVEITYNNFGTNNPMGAMYVLEENLEAVREAEGVPPGAPGVDTSVIEPLVLRASEGDTVEIEFVNSLGQHPDRDDFEERPASIHPTGVAYEVDESDGMKVGFNDNTVVEPGGSITYTWHADQRGAYFFHDGAYQAWDSIPGDGNNEEINSMARGLFGAIVVEPPGSTWTDPCTGAPLRSGTRADIHHPEMPDHREFVPVYHDHARVRPELNIPGTDIEQTLHGINYRAERTAERVGQTDFGGESFYSSWVHGDPGGGDIVFEAYQGDPVKFVPVGANPEENHAHHLHEHRWPEIPFDEDSDTIDSQSLGMGTAFEQFLTVAAGGRSLRPNVTADEAFEVGAGGYHGAIGDLLFHCHMFPHYGEGMNGMMRVHNQEQLHLQPLPNNEPVLPLDSPIAGFPDFIPAEEGEMPPKPPLSQVENPRQPTPTEQESLPSLAPGAPYTDPCLEGDAEEVDPDPAEDDIEAMEPDLVYDIVALPTKLVYNDHGDYDPDGKVFVLEEDEEAIKNGEMMPEPLFIRANVGDCIELNVRNELPDGTSTHVHFVGFDQLASDSATVGYNYDQATDPGETMTYRWFADDEGTIFFHDHISGIGEVMHGTFGALIVEPEGSEWLDPHTGEPIQHGSQAIINPPDDEPFREFCLQYHDFAPLIDPNFDLDTQPDDPEDEAFVNPHLQHGVNAGVGAINYRNTPYYRRGPDPDPAYLHSSFVHGDPETPTLEAYPEDQVMIRLSHGPYEEQHNFALHGQILDDFGFDPQDNVSQVITPSEQFNFRVREADAHDYEQQANAADLPIRDYLYGSMISHDLWDGMWGIHRVFDAEVDHLHPLPGREPPEGKITQKQLKEMGHPAAFDRRHKLGHKAKLIFDEPTTDPTHPPDRNRRRNEFVEGNPPPQAPSPGDPCPDAARTLEYDVMAMQTRIDFNEYGDHDPHGIVFALDEHVDDIKKGDRHPDPLLLRANVNDCVEVTLTNALPEEPDNHDDHPQMRTPERDLPIQWERSNRISLHPNHLTYDVNGSGGATIGFNYDQTIGPGESITYRWFADETEPAALWDMADVRSTRHHGAFGQFIVEPEGSEWLDACTGEPTVTSREAIITGGDEEFREFALSMSDARYIVNEDGTCVVPINPDDDEQDPDDPCNQVGDPEDQGYMAFNNRSEPFRRRFEANNPRQEHVYDSEIHGDPATPVFSAYIDDPVKFRVTQTADASRGISYHLANHRWERFEGVEDSPMIATDARFSPGKSLTMDPEGGAGGTAGDTGDFIYKEMKERRRLESGAWGILRVDELPHKLDKKADKKKHTHECDCAQPLPSRAKKVPLEERPGWTVATGDFTGERHNDILIGVPDSDRAGTDAGAAYLFYGPVASEDVTSLANADAALLGEHKGDRAGTNISVQKGMITIDTTRDTRYALFSDDLPHGTMSLANAHQQINLGR
ncbi:multicopper oxidase domain-containing protein [Natronococcus wangiae]|uniref:multicopper oxidase domain-containing protein n=1 Tax=Natronococcus wangiae TaxID=3068275 RepID=UPI00273F295B|nr:multicopper oxidase domain-containing protein [Natronococcus sp. AD5]